MRRILSWLIVVNALTTSLFMLGYGNKEEEHTGMPRKAAAPGTQRKTNDTLAPKEVVYTDKNSYFQVTLPPEWKKREFNDPRSKVEFFVPSPVADQSRASLFFLSHPLSGDVNVRNEAENRVARLKQMGAVDARVTTVEFAGVKAEQVEATLGRQNTRMRALMLTNYGRSYVISFTTTTQDYVQYWPIAENILKTFKCLPPTGVEVATDADKEKIQKEKIRVWITALKESDIGTDAFNSLLAIGKPAIPQLEEAERLGTPLQKQRASELLRKIRGENK